MSLADIEKRASQHRLQQYTQTYFRVSQAWNGYRGDGNEESEIGNERFISISQAIKLLEPIIGQNLSKPLSLQAYKLNQEIILGRRPGYRHRQRQQ